MKKVFEYKKGVKFNNRLFVWVIIINLLGFMLYISSENKSLFKYIAFLLLTAVILIAFSRKTSKLIFYKDYCVIYIAPFIKKKRNLDDVTIQVKFNKLITLKIDEPFIKVPYYKVLFEPDTRNEFMNYIKERDDINSEFKFELREM